MTTRVANTGDFPAVFPMLRQHRLIIHLIDMIAGKDDDVSGSVALHDVDVLINGVRCAGIPLLFGDALASRQNVIALIALGPEEIPTTL